MPKKMFFLSLLCSFIFYNCNNSNSWNQNKKEELIADCIKAGKDKVPNSLEIKDICECSTQPSPISILSPITQYGPILTEEWIFAFLEI